MNQNLFKILTQLKEAPSIEKVDHILLLEELYAIYQNGKKELQPIINFYLNDFENLPTLNEKPLWNKKNYKTLRKDFENNHEDLIQLINNTLTQLKDIETGNYEFQLTKVKFLNELKSGRLIFEEIDLENIDLNTQNLTGISFKNCTLAVDFQNCNLTNSSFINCNIKTSDFRNSNLTNALMENVSFEGTRFKGAKTKGFIFNNNYCFSEIGIGLSEFNDWVIET